MKVWHFEWGNDDFICQHETLEDAAANVAQTIVERRKADHYQNDFGKVYKALVEEGVEVKEYKVMVFEYRNF